MPELDAIEMTEGLSRYSPALQRWVIDEAHDDQPYADHDRPDNWDEDDD